MNDLVVLMSCELFQDIPRSVVEKDILRGCRVDLVTEGTSFLEPYDRLDRICVVAEGGLQVIQEVITGGRIILQSLAPGDLIGTELLGGAQAAAYRVESTCLSRILSFPVEYLLEQNWIREPYRSLVLRRLLAAASRDTIAINQRMIVLSQRSLRDRVLAYLSMQPVSNSDTILLPLNRTKMADYLCVNRTALSHELGAMEKEGLISFRKNIVKIRGVA